MDELVGAEGVGAVVGGHSVRGLSTGVSPHLSSKSMAEILRGEWPGPA